MSYPNVNVSLLDAEIAYLSEFLLSDDDDNDDWYDNFSLSVEEEEEEEEKVIMREEKSLEQELEDFQREWIQEIVQRQILLIEKEEEEKKYERRFHLDVLEKIAPFLTLDDLYHFLSTNNYLRDQRNEVVGQMKIIKLRNPSHLRVLFQFKIFFRVEPYAVQIDALQFPKILQANHEKETNSIEERNLIGLGGHIKSIEITINTRYPLLYLKTHYNLTDVILSIIYLPNVKDKRDEKEIAISLNRDASCLYFKRPNFSNVLINKAKEMHIKIGSQ